MEICHILHFFFPCIPSKDNMIRPVIWKIWMCSVLVWYLLQDTAQVTQVLCNFYLHKGDAKDIGGQLSVLANLKLDGFRCNYKWHSYLQWKCTLWEGAKSHHQELRHERGKDEGRVKSGSIVTNPSDFKEKKKGFLVTVAQTEISWFTRAN